MAIKLNSSSRVARARLTRARVGDNHVQNLGNSTMAKSTAPATLAQLIATGEAAKAAAGTSQYFIASALQSMAGDKVASVSAAAAAVGRGVYLAIKDGNLPPLQSAAVAVGQIVAKAREAKTSEAKAAAAIVSAAWVAALASCDSLNTCPLSGDVIDRRKSTAKRGGIEAALVAQSAAVDSFLSAAQSAAVAEAAKAEAAAAARKVKAEAAKAAKAEAAKAEAEAEAAAPAIDGTMVLSAAAAAMLIIATEAAAAAAPADMIAALIERNPAAVAWFIEAAAIMSAQRATDKAEAEAAVLATDKAEAEAAALEMAATEAAAAALEMAATEAAAAALEMAATEAPAPVVKAKAAKGKAKAEAATV